jgi:hypothetical protein
MCIDSAINHVGAIPAAISARNAAKLEKKEAAKEAKYRIGIAQDTRRQGMSEASLRLNQGSALVGAQRSAYGASGVRVDEGSPLDIIAGTWDAAEADAAAMQENADREATGIERDAAMIRRNANRKAKAASNNLGAVILTPGGGKGVSSADAMNTKSMFSGTNSASGMGAMSMMG